MKTHWFKPVAAGFALLLAALLSGCGRRGELSGTVTYEGNPVRFGTVVVLGGDGLAKYGNLDPEGRYHVQDLGTGECRIGVASPDPSQMTDLPADIKQQAIKVWFQVPTKYMHPKELGLTYSLRSGLNEYDIELK